MSDDRVEQLAGVVASLVQQVNRLTARLDVALELLAEARLSGSPDNAELINERLAKADAAAHINLSGSVQSGGASGAPSSVGSGGSGGESRIPDGTVTRRVVTRNVLPDGTVEVVEQIITEGYSEQAAAEVTRGPRTAERALDILDSLGKKR